LFSQNIKNVSEVPTQDVLSKISPLIMFFSGVEEGKKCPKCASGKLSVKMSKFGPFLGCSNYPECDFIQNLIEASASDSNSSGDNFSSGTSGVESQVWNLDGKTITLKNGKFGRYFEVVDGKNKKNASVPKNITELTDDVVLFYSSLPKKIGEFDDNPITLGIGKFGPYALCNKKFHSIKGKMLHEVSLDDVVDIIKNAKK
jgi:DNA topoisomerase-1